MQMYVKLYLESVVGGTFDLVRKITAGFPKKVLMGQKSSHWRGWQYSHVLCSDMSVSD